MVCNQQNKYNCYSILSYYLFNLFMSSNSLPSVSIILATYNWPEALKCVLESLEYQTYKNFEVIVADDGSKEATTKVVNYFKKKSNLNIKHVWQEDNGFRLARIRNLALKESSAKYIIFIDGDCIAPHNFVKNHVKLAEKGYFVSGNRVLLSNEFSKELFKNNIKLYKWNILNWLSAFLQKKCNRISPFFKLPFPRKLKTTKWQGARGCNLGIWKEDLIKTNGWEEKFIGWGLEDSDMLIRLFNSGVKRKEGRFAVPVIHIWHKESDRALLENSKKLLRQTQISKKITADIGLIQ